MSVIDAIKLVAKVKISEQNRAIFYIFSVLLKVLDKTRSSYVKNIVVLLKIQLEYALFNDRSRGE